MTQPNYYIIAGPVIASFVFSFLQRIYTIPEFFSDYERVSMSRRTTKINADRTKIDIFLHRLFTYIGMALLKYVISMIITSQMMKTDVRATLSNSAWNNIAIAWIAEI